jgi:hypothetical protein
VLWKAASWPLGRLTGREWQCPTDSGTVDGERERTGKRLLHGNGERGGLHATSQQRASEYALDGECLVWESKGEEVDGASLGSRTALEVAAGSARDALAET